METRKHLFETKFKTYLNEQEMSYDQKVAKSKSRKKINVEQLKKIIPVGKTATIMTAQEGYLLIVDENNNYYELV